MRRCARERPRSKASPDADPVRPTSPWIRILQLAGRNLAEKPQVLCLPSVCPAAQAVATRLCSGLKVQRAPPSVASTLAPQIPSRHFRIRSSLRECAVLPRLASDERMA